jgi:hypothetical protein
VPLSFINSWTKYSILRANPTGEFPFDLAFMYALHFRKTFSRPYQQVTRVN